MRHTWLGYAAGVVALGLVALLGNFVFYSGDLVMHAGNWELARIVFPAIITVLGWFITILWAFHHARIVAEDPCAWRLLTRINAEACSVSAVREEIQGVST